MLPEDKDVVSVLGEKKKPELIQAGSRVILVSNRLPITVTVNGNNCHVEPSVGGLATALWPMHEAGGGLWAGWPGELPPERGQRRQVLQQCRKKGLLPITINDKDFSDYYHGFCNSLLWPLFHDFVRVPQLNSAWWLAYRRANAAFAATLRRIVKPGDSVWVHDYHLLLLPKLLRKYFPEIRIGFFFHTPFPSSEIFRIIPWRRELLKGVLSADLVGFQAYDHLRHFRSAIERVGGLEVIAENVLQESRQIRLRTFPIGIDTALFRDSVIRNQATRSERKELRATLAGRRLILGVDRMDYTKGIPERLRAYERFLERFPAWRGRVELLQVGVPTRLQTLAYRDLREEVEGIVGHINGRFGSHEWTPVKYIFRPIPFPRLCALYSEAAVCLVTPLRDGMNLVAKEYVACQGVAGKGMLVLSEFAGAAAELPEALLVNPYDIDGLSLAIRKALVMNKLEKKTRMLSLARRVSLNDIKKWGENFLNSLSRGSGFLTQAAPPRLAGIERDKFFAAWHRAESRVMLLDYDGTLRSFAEQPDLAHPDRDLLVLLRALAELPATLLAIVSGRERKTLETWLAGLPLALIAEHGRWIRPVSGEWLDFLGGVTPPWLEEAKRIATHFAAGVPGSLVETKSASVAWHYRTANIEQSARRIEELTTLLASLSGHPAPEVLQGNKVVEVRVAGVNKAAACVSLLAGHDACDFIMAAGDDRTDEDLFSKLPLSAWTIHIGLNSSRARFSLADTKDFRSLLRELLQKAGAGGKK